MKNTFAAISSAGPHRDLSKAPVSSPFGMNTQSLLINWLMKGLF